MILLLAAGIREAASREGVLFEKTAFFLVNLDISGLRLTPLNNVFVYEFECQVQSKELDVVIVVMCSLEIYEIDSNNTR